ncbi:M14 family metallopeptidase [Diaphorobacter caeni]|uniref:M14 family metallopeptidase n=1 Tax=Diaphorobacter caeni TaxID=2784387 RepID=UPI00188FFEE0|nr:M14 family metallopeptidase [Diaphorobacter caeni]MBF5002790.1 M14 family metallopeptidase [Diaphorobacter caeni]
MIPIPDAFADRYALARARFIAGVASAGLSLKQYPHPLKGREGEELSVDVALDGDMDAKRLLIVSSGCHGVEGLCGSGVQVFALHDDEWREKARARGIAVLYVHALNPHGFSFLRRVTHENVDLNRNFIDFSQPLPANPAYDELHPILLPAQWPPALQNEMALGKLVSERGEAALQAIISRGQYQRPDGLFYGGREPTWSHLTLRSILRSYGGSASRIAWLDLHTGLGPFGFCERIYSGRNEAADMQRAIDWWSGGGATPVTVAGDGDSASAALTGQMHGAIHEECPQAEFTGLTLEFGTIPAVQVLQALRADQWLHLHADDADVDAGLAQQIHAQMRAAFFDESDGWKGQVISQARQAMFQAVDGLASEY